MTLIVTHHATELGVQSGAVRRNAPRPGMMSAAAALIVALGMGLGTAFGAETRGAPDVRRGERYDGLPFRTSAKQVLLAVPRAVLAIPRYTLRGSATRSGGCWR